MPKAKAKAAPDPVKFPAQLPYDKWPWVSNCFSAMIAGDWASAQAIFNMHTSDITDSVGAGNYYRDQYKPPAIVIITPPVDVGASPRPMHLDPGMVYAVQASGDAGFSFSVSSGGVQVVGSVSDVPGDFSVSNTQSGSGGIPRIPAKAGQWCNMKLGDGMQAQDGRFDLA